MPFRLEVGRSDQTELILHLRTQIATPTGRKHRYLQERRDYYEKSPKCIIIVLHLMAASLR